MYRSSIIEIEIAMRPATNFIPIQNRFCNHILNSSPQRMFVDNELLWIKFQLKSRIETKTIKPVQAKTENSRLVDITSLRTYRVTHIPNPIDDCYNLYLPIGQCFWDNLYIICTLTCWVKMFNMVEDSFLSEDPLKITLSVVRHTR